MEVNPIVSVVIPTRNRPAIVLRAVKSALSQTITDVEVIVVIDGIDPATVQALSEVKDPRLKVMACETSVGGAEARNIGVRQGKGEFVALLDDDDEWAPNKLERQLELAQASSALFPVITTRLIARRPDGDEIWPRRAMKQNESMSEYLLCREQSIRQGEGFIQTSTLLASRRLFLAMPFTPGLPRHQDWDWLIRVAEFPGVQFEWIWEPLTIYYIDAYRKSVSAGHALAPSIDWVTTNRLITAKARAYFYATQVAVRCPSPRVLCTVALKTIRYPRAFAIGMALALVPRNTVHRLRPRSVLTHA